MSKMASGVRVFTLLCGMILPVTAAHAAKGPGSFVAGLPTHGASVLHPQGVSSPCAPGFFSGTGNSPCAACAAGTFQPGTGSMSCIPTPAGDFDAGTANTAAHPCAAGTFSSSPGSTGCTACPAGTFSGSGATSCQAALLPGTPTLSVVASAILMFLLGFCAMHLLRR
jgi:hypothetical protein